MNAPCAQQFGINKRVVEQRRLHLERLEARLPLDAAGEFARPSTTVSAELASQVAPITTAPLVEYQIQVADMQGNSIDQVHVGDEFWLRIFVKDRRELPADALRLFAAYIELSIDSSRFEATAVGRLGDDFWNIGEARTAESESLPTGTQANRIGGLVTSPYPMETGHLLFEIPLRSVAEGEGTIATLPITSTNPKLYSTLLYGMNDEIPNSSITFGSLPINVLPKANAMTAEVQTPSLPIAPPPTSVNAGPPSVLPPPTTVSPPTSSATVSTPATVASPVVEFSPGVIAEEIGSSAPSDNLLDATTDSAPNDDTNAPPAEPAADEVWTVEFVDSQGELTRFIAAELSYSNHYRILHTTAVEISSVPTDVAMGPVGGERRRPATSSSVDRRDYRERESRERGPDRDVFDKIFDRFSMFSPSHEHAEDLLWETSFARASMRRLPLRSTISTYPTPGVSLENGDFAEIAPPRPFAPGAVPPTSERGLPTDGPVAVNWDRTDDGLSFHRVAIRPMALMLDLTQLPTEIQVATDANSYQTTSPAALQVAEPAWERTRVQASRENWSNPILVGLCTLYFWALGRRKNRAAEALRREPRQLTSTRHTG